MSKNQGKLMQKFRKSRQFQRKILENGDKFKEKFSNNREKFQEKIVETQKFEKLIKIEKETRKNTEKSS